MNLQIAVQHHPARAHLLPDLLSSLGGAQVVTDPEPEGKRAPIRTYLACLKSLRPDASHLLVIQDDAVPCDDFRTRAETAIREHPDTLVTLFLAGAPIRSARHALQARRRGESWSLMQPGDWTPTVALCWPSAIVARFLVFAEAQPALIRTGDDNAVGAFTRVERLTVWVTVPSLVEHPDVEPSLIGRKASGGKNRMRTAALPPEVL